MGRIMRIREHRLRRRMTRAHMKGLAVVRIVAIRAEKSCAPMFRAVPVHQIAMTGRVTVETDPVRREADMRRIGHILDMALA